ncbi:MAG: aldo/keto reductase [Ruminococcaceae bacterium]|nr:aldo/keto reductase [Oscillospiraceae bacterium]
MKQLKLNRTELTVSEICLGADRFGSTLDRETAFAMLDKFRAAGGNFIDTASLYVRDWDRKISVSEEILGEYLRKNGKDSLIIATKGAHPNLDTMHISRINREEITADLDESLTTLGLDCIDFYWLHRDNPEMPIGEIVELMEEFVRAGKIRYYGGSNYTAARMREADAYAKAHGLHGFSGVSNMWMPAKQNPGHPLYNDKTLVGFTDEDLTLFADTGMAFVPFSSTARGWFSKAAAGKADERLDGVFDNAENRALLEKFKAADCSVQTALLRHIRTYPVQIVPVTSASRLSQLDDILAV